MSIDKNNINKNQGTSIPTSGKSTMASSTNNNKMSNQDMTVDSDNLVETLNDLIKINNDRIVGYEKAVDQAKDLDVDLKAVFTKMANESRDYVKTLTSEVTSLGGEVAHDTTASGKIYRAWMSVKNLFTGSDRKSILESCEFGEDAAQKAYKEALADDVEIPATLRQTIMDQKTKLKTSHDLIKKYRDMHK